MDNGRRRVLITGGRGQLAADLTTTFADCEVWAPGRDELDILDAGQIRAALDRFRPHSLLNTAAYNAVDLAESEPEPAFLVNAVAPQRLARSCRDRGVRLVHYSTDYVFGGGGHPPFLEHHPVAPINIYGASKAAGELAIRATTTNSLIIRTTGLYGLGALANGHGNFVETMIRLGGTEPVTRVVSDQILTPTSTVDLAALTRELLERDATGTVHVTNGGHCTWYTFAKEIFRLARLPGVLVPVSQDDRPQPARRPGCSVLAHGALRTFNLPEPRPWEAALADYLSRRDAIVSAGVLSGTNG